MPQLAIHARGLRKVYRVYPHPFAAIAEAVTRRSRHYERIALDSVDLDLRRGEIVGVLGRNGAGKSTLLKIIAGTLQRSAGELEIAGRITAILELGTGFHPDYTGRENIYMGGLCLGMKRQEVDSKIETIIDFSELREVIDQPFKTYSTGMQARLTFSTAISVEPDILIVDEALSVGDARFQQKCFARLQQLRARQTTILLVSHDTNTITALCSRALILEGGRVVAEGDAKRISSLYHNLLFGKGSMLKTEEQPQETPVANEPVAVVTSTADNAPPAKFGARYGNGAAQLLDWGLVDQTGQRLRVMETGTPFRLYMRLRFHQAVVDLSCGFAIKDRRGTVLWGVTNIAYQLPPYAAAAGETLTIVSDGIMWLAAGDYFINLGAGHLEDGSKIDFIEDALEFTVLGPGNIFTTSVVNLQAVFTIASDRPE